MLFRCPPLVASRIHKTTAIRLVFICIAALIIFYFASASIDPPTSAAALLDTNAPANITYTELPQAFSLIPRDLQSNQGFVHFAGTVNSTGITEVIVRAFAGEQNATAAGDCSGDSNENGSPYAVERQPLTFDGDAGADFSLMVSIEAQLTNYQFEVCLLDSTGESLDRTITDIVAGDVFLIQGQSNANAFKRGDSSASSNEGQFIRSFGSRITSFNSPDGSGNGQSDDLDAIGNDQSWHQADGDGAQTAGAVGQWGIRLGRRIVDEFGIPVAILNHAVPGTKIGQHQRDDGNPMRLDGFNSGGIYGRLLWRAEQASVAEQARAMLWYQGESDHGDAAGHLAGFRALYQDWLEDYSGLELVYVHQIRNVGSLCNSHDPQLRENQRALGNSPELPKVRLMSTTAIDAQVDGCHFPYTGGYEVVGDNIFGLVARDLYGDKGRTDVEPPNIGFAYFTDNERREVVLTLKNETDTYSWQNGAEQDFSLTDGGVSIINGRVDANEILLTLDGQASSTSALHYFGHPGVNPPGVDNRFGQWVTNANGVGLLAFYNVPIALDTPQIQVTVENNQQSVFRQSLVKLNVTLLDADGLSSLALYVNDTIVSMQNFADSPKDATASIDWMPNALGLHTIKAVAIDTAGARSQNMSVAIEVVNQPPSIAINEIMPEPPLVLGDGSATVSVSAMDADGQIESLQLLVDGAVAESLETDTVNPPWSFTWAPPTSGAFSVAVRAVDNEGATATSDSTTITIVAPTPTPAATETPTATPTSSATPTLTSTPTETPTPIPTATFTATPTPEPATLSVLPKAGAPGSLFTLEGRNLLPGQSLDIYVNRILFGTAVIGANGQFKIVLATDQESNAGAYFVVVSLSGEKASLLESAYVVDSAATVGTSQEQLEHIELPSSLGSIYLPILVADDE